MENMAIKKEVAGQIEEVCAKITEVIKPIGFGILTRIDFDQKIQEKINEKIERCVILGACNPRLAYEAYKQSSDVALLIPCNIVVRELKNGKLMVEALRPSKMLDLLKDVSGAESINKAERDLEKVILSL